METAVRSIEDVQLGGEYDDVLSGFTGYAIGKAEYLNGCVQVHLEAHQPDNTDGKYTAPVSYWVDIQRLRATGEVVSLPGDATATVPYRS